MIGLMSERTEMSVYLEVEDGRVEERREATTMTEGVTASMRETEKEKETEAEAEAGMNGREREAPDGAMIMGVVRRSAAQTDGEGRGSASAV